MQGLFGASSQPCSVGWGECGGRIMPQWQNQGLPWHLCRMPGRPCPGNAGDLRKPGALSKPPCPLPEKAAPR